MAKYGEGVARNSAEEAKKIGRRQHPDLVETSPCIRVREDLISICYRY